MTTDVAVVPQTNGQVDFGGLMKLCEALVPTGFLPDHIKNAGQAAAIVLAGQELGMTPMLALRSITMVKGKVVVAADAQLALFKARGGRAVFSELTDNAAILKLVHPNGDEHTEVFTMKDAQRAGLTRNATWTSYPRAMLRSRVITAGLKSIGFEPTAGAYDPEEAASFTATPVVEGENSGNPTEANPSEEPSTTRPTEGGSATNDESDEITRDTPFPLGAMKGKTVAEFTDAHLHWGATEGRNLGPATDEWQQVMKAEIARRADERRDIEEESEEAAELEARLLGRATA